MSMFDPKIVDEVRDHLTGRRNAYIDLLTRIRDAAKAIQSELGTSVIHQIYSRGEKSGGDEFKSVQKVARKLAKRRRNDSHFVVAKINDIVGLTIVVTYLDEVSGVEIRLKEYLQRLHIETSKSELKKENGYYATHIDCTARTGSAVGLICEVQIKTMLHNVWGTKTHDMTYKPRGRHDSQLTDLMQIIGDSIEIIEKQSSRLRQLIETQWSIEKDTRRLARRRMFESLVSAERDPTIERSPFIELLEEIVHDEHRIRTMADSDEHLARLEERIGSLVELDPMAWRLAVRLSIARDDGCTQFASSLIEPFKAAALRTLNRRGTDEERAEAERRLKLAVMSLYVLGMMDDAIVTSYEVLAADVVSESTRAEIGFNLATFLAEQECQAPSSLDDRVALEAEVTRLLENALPGLEPILAQDGPDIVATTKALLDITFSTDAETVREAIRTCSHSPIDEAAEDHDITAAYAEYYTRLGWRRLFYMSSGAGGLPPT